MDRYRIALADDHALFRQGLRKIIETAGDVEVVGEAGDGAELMKLLGVSAPDLVVLDISMPKLSGMEAIGEIKARHPEVKILVLTMHKEYLYKTLSAGVDGYLLKEDADRELFSAIENIRQGRVFVSPRLTGEIMEAGAALSDPLTTREKEVLKLIADGKSNKDMAEALYVSIRTVESHRASIIKKLNLKKPADLVRYAMQKGYI